MSAVIVLSPSMDLTPMALQLAVDRYRAEHDADPWGLIVDTTWHFAEVVRIAGEVSERMGVEALDIPQDYWIVYGPHGLIISEGA